MADHAVVFVEGARAEVGGLDCLPDDVGFADPRALLGGEADGDGVSGGLEGGNEGVHVGGGLVGRRAVVVDYLYCC